MYAVKEIFYTLQGEGANAGRAAVFCRFAGCNLWSGREEDRATAQCRFCDTDFTGVDGDGGGRFATAEDLAAACAAVRPVFPPHSAMIEPFPLSQRHGRLRGHGEKGGGRNQKQSLAMAISTSRPLLVLTGGEPMLQVDRPLIDVLHAAGFEIAAETNGTLPVPRSVDWICVSPKAGTDLRQTSGDELKLVFPQEGAPPDAFEGLDFAHRFLQPMDGPDREKNTALAIDYCKAHPQWRLSIQTHKVLGIR